MSEFLKNMKFMWKYAKGEKKSIIAFALLNIINVIVGVFYPILMAQIIVKLTENNLEQFIFIGGVLLSILLIDDTIEFIDRKLYQRVFRNIYINIQTDLGSEILKLNNKTLEDNGTGVFIQRLVGDTKNISTIFTSVIDYLNGIVTNIGILVTYFILSKVLFLFIVFCLVLRFIIETKRINTFNENDKNLRKNNDALTGFTSEIVRGAEDIKMLNGEASFIKELKNKFQKINDEKYKMQNTNLIYFLIRWYLGAISQFIIILIIASQVYYGAITVAIGVVLYNFGNRYGNLVSNITGFHELIKDFNLSATRIFDIFFDKKYEKEIFGNKHLSKINGDFEFKDVSFKYGKNKVLNKLSFNVKANETVAFVGKSGAGKTTIFNLLCKMYDNYTGSITIDGINIKELDKDSIRGNITIVSQNPYIFNMSIRDNLRLVKESLTNKEMKEACKMACLDEYIESLPNKYDTIVGEGGINLSGGQKQRLAIARAFVQKTEIILFDEATSALDNETQRHIQEAIDNLQKDYTILIIAHRLSTIKNSDRILVLDGGKIIASGKHDELLENCKQYKELYETEINKKE